LSARLELEGTIDDAALDALREALAREPAAETALLVDMGEADVESAAVVARLADLLRREARRLGAIELLSAPQTLAHTLYRIGALESGALVLVDPREELGSSG
jgi:anti-anti-sigma regulatory factor